MEFWNKQFLAGVNVGSISIFIAWLLLGQFAMFIMAIYILASVVQWWRKPKESQVIFEIRPDSPFEPIDDLDIFSVEASQNDQNSTFDEQKEP